MAPSILTPLEGLDDTDKGFMVINNIRKASATLSLNSRAKISLEPRVGIPEDEVNEPGSTLWREIYAP